MMKGKTLIFVLLLNLVGVSGFPIEINPLLYTNCDILIVRPVYRHQTSRVVDINAILLDTLESQKLQGRIAFTIVITDAALNFSGVHKLFSKALVQGVVAHTYVSRKISHGMKNRCSVLLTTERYMESGRKLGHRYEYQYRLSWGLWIREASQNKLGLVPFSSAHVTLAFVSFGEKRTRYPHGTLYRSPFLTYVVIVKENSQLAYVIDICSGSCSLTASLYKKINIFKGKLGRYILSIPFRDLRSAYVFTTAAQVFKYIFQCEPTKQSLHLFGLHKRCLSHAIAPLLELGEKLNVSFRHEVFIDKRAPAKYYVGAVLHKGMNLYELLAADLSTGLPVLDDRYARVFLYCTQALSYESISVLNTLFIFFAKKFG